MSELEDKQYASSLNYLARINLHHKFSTNKYSWPLWVFDNITKTDNARVLEIGCGNGILWKLNSHRIPLSWEITLTDFSEGMLKDAESVIGESGIRYMVMGAESIPFEDNSFDIIFANHMMYHVQDRKKALSEICRVLKSDGIFYASTMEEGYMSELTGIVREFRSVSHDGMKKSSSVIENFSLENGEEQLREYFSKIQLNIYNNSLTITDALPLTDYVFSLNNITPGRIIINENEKEAFTNLLQRIIERDGFIKISSNAGLFICRSS